ncbi:protein translocation protein SEC63 [Dothidotthia symphoricarpi CBS 119687]|uniref:Protein translocation protein SEC63 n=1 Tax=Dothidotthia symphoricarpi CBS 119687 TaxID=1392245 RepID=A0A6A6A2B5_9PLEO|nr:protein translocation protein SEC63 [Dothidotthia symphoricarpi CBS 119687]KAF2124721.1 protein translocation protein SEC63 [Dothidotthia symphoricarpi CBS 119687]
MSGTDYNYDSEAQFFPYFILTVTTLVTVPATISFFRPSKELENTGTRIDSDFTPEHADLIQGQRKKQKRAERRIKRGILMLIGWALNALMVYLIIVTARSVTKIWDPYEVLGVSRSADEKAIKKHYRKLSLLLHPDKAREDPAKNITIQSINDHWVDVTKAFKALTDEEIRNNYVQYGHPDGKQSFSIGIALPKWIVTEGAGKYVLLIYALALGVLLPYMVGKWWYGTQRLTKEKVLIASAGKIFREYENEQGETGVIGALSSGEEFNEVLAGNKAESGLSKLEQKVLSDSSDSLVSQTLTKKDRQKLDDQEDSRRRKVLTLLWAYLGRVELDDDALNDEKFEVAPVALRLNDAYTAIALAYGSTKAVLAAYHTSQSLIQALRPGASPLEQLPYFTPAVATAAEAERSRTHLTVQEFLHLPEEQRKSRVVAPGLLSPEQYSTALSVASRIPVLNVDAAFFKVVGERFVTPSSLVQFVLKCRFIPSGATNIPEANPKDLLDIDPEEGDIAALTGRKNDRSGEKPIQPPLAHAPYYARDHAPRWHVFLADSKQGRVAVPPFTFSTFDKPILDESGNPTFDVQTLKMQFGAPPQAGSYTFVMHMICDSYIGMDTKMEVTLVVEDASKAEEVEEDGEISEPDEDTIAGQMRTLKGDAPLKKRRQHDDSSDGSDTEGDVESESETDTDTDSDDE